MAVGSLHIMSCTSRCTDQEAESDDELQNCLTIDDVQVCCTETGYRTVLHLVSQSEK